MQTIYNRLEQRKEKAETEAAKYWKAYHKTAAECGGVYNEGLAKLQAYRIKWANIFASDAVDFNIRMQEIKRLYL